MPPKDLMKLGIRKLMIMSADGEWKELGGVVENPILEPICEGIKTYDIAPTKVSFTFHAKWKNRTRLLQELGYLKRPKLTYKTNRKYQRPKHNRKH